MNSIILYIATSLDGYIARSDGAIDWLSRADSDVTDYGYGAFLTTIGTVILGRKTYDQILSFGEYPYKGVNSFVVTSRANQKEPQEGIHFLQTITDTVIDQIREESEGDIWVVGGAGLIHSLMRLNCIDEYIITVLPHMLGGGISLFESFKQEIPCTLASSTVYDGGVVQLHYRRKDQ